MGTALLLLRVLVLVGPPVAGLVLRLYQARRGTGPGATPTGGPAVQKRQGSRLPLVAWTIAGGLYLVALCLPSALPPWTESALLLLAGVGGVLTAGGTAVGLWARAALGARWSLVPRAGREAGLVTWGPFARVRHPVYLGVLAILAGVAVAFANWVALLVCLLLVVPALLWRAKVEEALLADVFGEEYRLYRRRTKMLIPYVV